MWTVCLCSGLWEMCVKTFHTVEQDNNEKQLRERTMCSSLLCCSFHYPLRQTYKNSIKRPCSDLNTHAHAWTTTMLMHQLISVTEASPVAGVVDVGGLHESQSLSHLIIAISLLTSIICIFATSLNYCLFELYSTVSVPPYFVCMFSRLWDCVDVYVWVVIANSWQDL